MADKWTLATKKLLKETASGERKWHRLYDPEDFHPNGTVRGFVYRTSESGKNILIYEESDLDDPEGVLPFASSHVVIEFASDSNRIEWQWPNTPYDWQLLDAVRLQESSGEEFLESFLNPQPGD